MKTSPQKEEQALVERVLNSASFKAYVAKKTRFGWILSVIMLLIYYGFIVTLAFSPELLGTPISANGVMTWGIPVGLGVIFACFILTGIYVRRANAEFDDMNAAILKEAGL